MKSNISAQCFDTNEHHDGFMKVVKNIGHLLYIVDRKESSYNDSSAVPNYYWNVSNKIHGLKCTCELISRIFFISDLTHVYLEQCLYLIVPVITSAVKFILYFILFFTLGEHFGHNKK